MKRHIKNGIPWIAALLTVAVAGGCGSTYQLRDTKTSGFLEDYSMLQPGKKGESLLVYLKPDADFSKYDAIQIDPITVYAAEGGALHEATDQELHEEIKPLADYLDAVLREQLSTDYRLTDEAGPKTIRLRVAITEADSANVILDTVSTIVPIGMAVSALKHAITGKGAFVGEAGIEAELLDSRTGERLVAAVDRRAGSKVTGELNKFDKWRAAKDCFDYWVLRLKTRLAEERRKDLE